MSMFKKLLASVGIGSAQVDARLEQDSLMPGDMVRGEIHIAGGDVAQEIDDIYMYVVTHYEREVNDSKVKEECILVKHRLSERFTLLPKERRVLPFAFQLPYETPLTIGRQPVYLRTGLDIKNAIDPADSDFIEVRPHPLMAKVLDAIQRIGFQLYKVDCEYNRYLGRRYPFVQEFEFRPIGPYRSRLEELEAVFHLRDGELEVLLELDKRARGLLGALEEAFNLDERYARFRLTEADLNRPTDMIADQIEEIIRRNIR
ncbi:MULTISPECIES: sporulation protein [Bacillales]|jgi:sporulation-control protein|uniref:Sporulation protein SpoOM n=1 Tax=Brevibacillus aydinogluensis TaxID=927786 RepID=A0AA48M5R0_9BACL|nr:MULTISPECIES: sporulation protein [Bacillales]REK61301.1 MAG: sporulation protein SpoOM [Brevibacillus sp.]MBR8660886.1 sporulation protein [Brevibacillus sp. NL20B1]MDT3416914.1 sporulation-control protein [Brevibacillus aydinogluensis]NNV04533.1 sporulation protein SpoOM [Brevibacillus sp. MCWH]UFJ61398.1 sporulation protein [Anoxybacillus sediminis]